MGAPHLAAVLGASGNVGKALVSELSAHEAVSRIILINRRDVPELSNLPKVEQHIVNLDDGTAMEPLLKGADSIFITLGVGKPKDVSKEELRRVDVTIPTHFAQAASRAGVQYCALLTSAGTDINATESWLTGTAAGGGLYRHLKGQVEANVSGLGFRRVGLFRPATLVGSSNTPSIMEWVSPVISTVLPARFKEIHIKDLARAMARHAMQDAGPGIDVLEGHSLFALTK